METVNVGDVKTLKIEGLNTEFEGIARPDNFVVFVPQALPGETVEVKITEKKKSFARAELVKIIDNTHYRVKPQCPHYDKCGGCDLQHVGYDKSLELKRHILADNLKRLGKIDFPEEKIGILSGENKVHYRNKFIMPVRKGNDGRLACGAFQRGTHDIIEIPECIVQDTTAREIMNYIIEKARAYGIEPYDEVNHRGYLRALGYRVEKRTKKVLVFFVTTKKDATPLEKLVGDLDFRFGSIASIYMNVNPERGNALLGKTNVLLEGKEYLDMYLGKAMYRALPNTFFQVNSEMAEKMFNKVIELLPFERWEVIWDLYAGVGAITFFLASEFKRIHMIEKNPESVKMAELMKKINFADNVTIDKGDLDFFDLDQMERPEVVILDPPRKGVSMHVIETLKKIQPRKIIMISCNSTTLARDLDRLRDDYEIKKMFMGDMFPQTRHIESLTMIERKGDGSDL